MQFLDPETGRQLGFNEIWSRISPVSPVGRSRLSKTQAFEPHESADLQLELHRLDHICQDLKRDPHLSEHLSYLLGSVRDIGGSLRRCREGAVLDDLELYEVKKLLIIAEKVQNELEHLSWTTVLPKPWDPCFECLSVLSLGQGGQDSFYISDAYDAELAKVRRERVTLEGILTDFQTSVDKAIFQAVGRILSMQGEISVSAMDGKRISKLENMDHLEKVRETTDFVTFRLVDDEATGQVRKTLSKVRDEEERLKQKVRVKLTAVIADHAQRLFGILEQLAYVDVLLAKAQYCTAIDGVKPQLCEGSLLRIEGGRHPLVEEEVTQRGYDYTPLSLEVASGVTLITGPNMGGKTASLKTIGLLVAMAQYGLLVPATSMEFNPRKFVRAHLAAAEIPKGLSSFAGEVVFLREVMEASHEEGLLLVDELAHGTSPAEGASVAQAILEYLRLRPTMSVVTTHYPELARLEGVRHLRVKGLAKDKHGTIQIGSLQRHMDYRLEVSSPGNVLPSDATIVAEALGLDRAIIERAKELVEKRDSTNG